MRRTQVICDRCGFLKDIEVPIELDRAAFDKYENSIERYFVKVDFCFDCYKVVRKMCDYEEEEIVEGKKNDDISM
jgi:hypothetical protein